MSESKAHVVSPSRSVDPRKAEHRAIQKLYAKICGYFWLPCPLCGREFGGHEWHDIGDLSSTIYVDPDNPGHGTGICPVCTAQGRGQRIKGFIGKDVMTLRNTGR